MYGKKEGKKRNCHASLKKDCEPGFGLKPHIVGADFRKTLGFCERRPKTFLL
jgi:hypothetical protein